MSQCFYQDKDVTMDKFFSFRDAGTPTPAPRIQPPAGWAEPAALDMRGRRQAAAVARALVAQAEAADLAARARAVEAAELAGAAPSRVSGYDNAAVMRRRARLAAQAVGG